MKYPFEKHFLICTGKRCNNADRERERGDCIREELKDLNKSMGRKPTVRVCGVTCLDMCDDGPNMLVWPEGDVYTHLDRDEARRVYHRIMGDE